MRKLFLMTAIAVMTATAADAATWVAICNDGQHLQYNQTVGGSGFLYLSTPGGSIPGTGTQVAPLTQSFYNGTAICGAVPGNGTAPGGAPMTQLCANKSTGIIYIKWQSPTGGPIKDGTYCKATVKVQ